MNALIPIQRFIFEAKAWRLIAAVMAAMLVKTGVWWMPNLDHQVEIARNPFANPFTHEGSHYLYWTWLGPLIAHLIGATGNWSFFALHLACSIAFTAVVVGLLFSRLSDRSARIALILFAALPVSATAYYWVGMDSLTLLLMALAVAAIRRPLLLAPIGLALGMHHFEQALFGTVALLVATVFGRRETDGADCSPRAALALLAGVIAGKLALVALFHAFGTQVNSGRAYWFLAHWRDFRDQLFFHGQAVLWSLLGLGWLAAFKYADKGRAALPFFAGLALLMGTVLLGGDQTRVFSIAAFMLLAVFWLLNPNFLEGVTEPQAAGVFLLWLLMPWSWMWAGAPRLSASSYDLAYVLHKAFGWFQVPANPAEWPF
ncbi:MAG: hypothetical protein Q8M88_06815 [Phenylobacterium sp.]|uniref:hypothetical protein n=1 Tax=Phenylobacterium sp. TaxID=1871053 RepID=UPI0027341EE1|nr:hypothetical protein [Phenylobacterium sp.]MDP3174131.1 hypothetical protein [Phenylobacterium sp.]